MTAEAKTIVLRLIGDDNEGAWWAIPREPFVYDRRARGREPGFDIVQMVATGDVEWDGDTCAEVYVPEDRVDVWRAEFSGS